MYEPRDAGRKQPAMSSAPALDFFRQFVRERAAIVLSPEKNYLIESRLAPVANDAGVDGLDGLVTKLRGGSNQALATTVVEALTTNETYFFRDRHPFETLEKTLIPALMKARFATRKLRVWCAAASTGQEPYTIAMVLDKVLRSKPGWSAEITATDLNQTVLQRAREGQYWQHEVDRGLPPQMLTRHFDPVGSNWEVKPSLKRMVRFQQLNLLDQWAFRSRFDIVFARNVLIYFETAVKHRILDRMLRHVEEDGLLLLGASETTVGVHDGYTQARAGRTTYFTIT